MSQMNLPNTDPSPYRRVIDSLSKIYINGKDFVEYLKRNRASRQLMIDGYNMYVLEGKFEPIEDLTRELRAELWEEAKNMPGETTGEKVDLCRAIYFLMWKSENPEK
jgi:hypothetical protein